MAEIRSSYGTSNQALTITIASMANAAAQESTAVDNSTNKFLDALLQVKVKTNAAGTGATGYVAVYAYGSVDGGSTYGGEATGTNAAVTLTVPPNTRLIGIINTVANATTYESRLMSIASAFDGVMPDHWGIVIQNVSGAALDATGGSHSALWQGVKSETA